ncbi:GG10762, related [Neospora caninum Liverpool]|uniref:Adenosine kinase n=1 Tax=Neospora caninum (strain Liverpool) TaxID=572307 RepID=F0VR68_NEOCL|nr:GG10762, related [Neospora caninum Liverpool]CBZ56216.1 GG10762, related [Neospora caninum Liverpool]CEL70978.1 TPA: GG10762, related [Neospora caninum Liverpool]|eukprot:XP_003886241.1 GG10762, related [Neospora caninum Liverpool]
MTGDASAPNAGQVKLFAIGNPILDLVAEVPASFLEEFSLKRGEAVLASPEQRRVYVEVEKFNPTRMTGGSALNTSRVAQQLFKMPGSVAYMGAIGDDDRGTQLKDLCDKEGLATRFMVAPGEPTAVCAVLINQKERTLCTDLGACLAFRLPADWETVVRDTRFFYATAYTISASPDNALAVARYAATKPGSVFTLNLSALFCIEVYKDALKTLFPLTNILVGNDEEFAHLARVHDVVAEDKKQMSTQDRDHAVSVCTGALGLLTAGQNAGVTKLAVMTRGESSVIAAESAADGTVVIHEVEVPKVPDEKIVDTNGAGDAFIGGFLYAFAQGRSVRDSIVCGNACARNVIMHEGFAVDFSAFSW